MVQYDFRRLVIMLQELAVQRCDANAFGWFVGVGGQNENVYNKFRELVNRMDGWAYATSCGNCGADMGFEFVVNYSFNHMHFNISPLSKAMPPVGCYYPVYKGSDANIYFDLSTYPTGFTCHSCGVNNESGTKFVNTVLTRILD